MRIFPSLSAGPGKFDAFWNFPHGLVPLRRYHDAKLRCESPLGIDEGKHFQSQILYRFCPAAPRADESSPVTNLFFCFALGT
jgi:hypothetical protein